jgi:hypothetical protein
MSDTVADLQCDCCLRETDVLHDLVARADSFVAKARGVNDMLRIARVELRMREYLLAQWRVRSRSAAGAAQRVIRGGGTPASALTSVDRVMRRFIEDVRKRYSSDIEEVYRLARSAGWKRATGQTREPLIYDAATFVEKARPRRRTRGVTIRPTFTLADERAIADLVEDQMLWIGEHYDSNVRRTLRDTLNPTLVAGLGSQDAGSRVADVVSERLRDIRLPGGFNGSDAQYFEGLAANTTTGARVRGQIASFVDAEIEHYEIVNPMDKRTSLICARMNGEKFSIRRAIDQIERESEASTPDKLRAAHPWVSSSRASELTGERDLSKAGLSLPPYHFRCRTTVDMSTS